MTKLCVKTILNSRLEYIMVACSYRAVVVQVLYTVYMLQYVVGYHHMPVCMHIWSLLCALQVFASSPGHPVWKRERLPHHGGAHRIHPDTEISIKLSQSSSQICDQCDSAVAQGNSRWCSSGTDCHSSISFLPIRSRVCRPSISAPLFKKRKVKMDQEKQSTTRTRSLN